MSICFTSRKTSLCQYVCSVKIGPIGRQLNQLLIIIEHGLTFAWKLLSGIYINMYIFLG